VKRIRSDNGGEYTGKAVKDFLAKRGIIQELTAPYTPQQNGMAERKNRTLCEMARSMLKHAHLPESYWGEAINYANLICNCTTSSMMREKTPFEAWNKLKPDISSFRVFGCRAYALIPKELRTKFDSKAQPCVYLGPDFNHSTFKLFNLSSKKIIKSRDVVFDESILGTNLSTSHQIISQPSSITEYDFSDLFPFPTAHVEPEHKPHEEPYDRQETSPPQDFEDYDPELKHAISDLEKVLRPASPHVHFESSPGMSRDVSPLPDDDDLPEDDVLTESPDGQESPEQPPTFEPSLRRSNRISRTPLRFDEESHTASGVFPSDPSTYSEAISGPSSEEWSEAIRKEHTSLLDNDTWVLTPLPHGRKAIGSKWVFKVKTKSDGSIDRYKARLVAKGYTQVEGVDYDETFSPVARLTSIRTLLALAAHYHLDIYQMDVDAAYLNGHLSEEIYMKQPEGLIDPQHPDFVCKLQRSLYGLKQSGRVWHETLDDFLLKCGFSNNTADTCVYYRNSDEGRIIIAVYVDDLVILTNSDSILARTKRVLNQRFHMKDLGPAHYILGIKIERKPDGSIFMSQDRYNREILSSFDMDDSSPITLPIVGGDLAEFPESPPFSDPSKYRQAVGKLMYTVAATRPDLAFATHFVSRFNREPKEAHWNIVKRIL
jgi:hypothetical protein